MKAPRVTTTSDDELGLTIVKAVTQTGRTEVEVRMYKTGWTQCTIKRDGQVWWQGPIVGAEHADELFDSLKEPKAERIERASEQLNKLRRQGDGD